MIQIVAKDIKNLLKEKTILAVVLLIFFIASFATIISLGFLILYNPESVGMQTSVKVAVVGKNMDFGIKYDSLDRAMEDFYNRKVDAIVVFHGNRTVDVILPKDEAITLRAVSYLRDKFLEYEDKVRRSIGIYKPEFKVYNLELKEVKVPRRISSSYEFIYSILIPIVVLTVALVCASLLIDIISEEYERKTIYIFLSAPTSIREIILAKISVSLLLLIFLTILWMSAFYIRGIEIKNPHIVFLLSLAIGVIFISLSVLIVSAFLDRNRSQLLFSIVSISIITVSFVFPEMPSGTIARVCADGYFNYGEILGYTIISTLTFIFSLMLSERLLKNLL